MKKIMGSLLVGILTLSLSFTSVSALNYDTSKIDNAYNKVVEYYENSKKVNSFDEIIAVESLGLEVENGYQLPDNFGNIDLENTTVGTLTKTIVSEILIGNDPKNINGINLVETLENMIEFDVNGNVIFNHNSVTSAGELVYIVYALYSVDSEKLNDVVNALISTANEDGSFGYGPGTTSLDITGWVLEALALTQKDKMKTLEFLNSKIDNSDGAFSYEGSWGEEGKNSNTQACILAGLFASDKDQVINGYENCTVHPIDFLINLQKNDGSFYYTDGNDGWNPSSTTLDAARAIGTYKKGSVYEKVRNNYREILNNNNFEQVPDNTNNTNNTQTTPSTNQSVQSVKTGDESQVGLFMTVSMVSGALYLVLRKENERVH